MRPRHLLLATIVIFLLMGPVESLAARYVSADLQNRLSILIAATACFSLVPLAAASRGANISNALKAGWPAAAFIGLALISASWSLLPGKTILYSMQAGFAVAAAIALVSMLRWPELLGAIAIAAFAITIISALLIPVGGLMDEIHIGAFRGVYPEKNRAAEVFCLGALAAAGMGMQRRNFLWLIPAACMAVSVYFTQSTTSLIAVLLGLGILVACEIVRNRPVMLLLSLWIGITLVAGAVIVAIVHPEQLYTLAGDNTTLTGRSDIWPAIIRRIQAHPLTGLGYGAFWDEANIGREWLWQEINFQAFNAHNSWLEVWLGIGIAGVLLQAWFMLRTIAMSITSLFAQDDMRRMALPLMLAILVMSISESIIGGPEGPVWLVFLLIGTMAPMNREAPVTQPR